MRFSLPIVLVTLLLGCGSPRAGQPLASDLAGNDPETQVNFWHALTEQPVTSNDQAFHGLLLYADGRDPANDYAGRVAELKRRRMLPADFDEPAEAAARRGVIAVAIMRLLNERGGVTARLFGLHPRYAVRELMFLNVYPPSTPNQTFSGHEFVGIIGAVEDYQRSTDADVPAAALRADAATTAPPAAGAPDVRR